MLLQAKRDCYADDEEHHHFYHRLRGGQNIADIVAVVSDRAETRHYTHCQSFVDTFSYAPQYSWAFGAYGEEHAVMLAKAASHRASCSFAYWIRCGSPHECDFEGYIDDNLEPIWILDWACSLNTEDAAFDAFMRIKQFVPHKKIA